MKIQEIIDSMKDFPFFVGRDNIVQAIKWEAVGNSSVVFDRVNNEEAAFVFPVQITPNRLFVGPLGAYSGNVGTLEKAKYRMTCAAPNDPTLRDMFQTAVELFGTLEGQIVRTGDRRYLLETTTVDPHIIASLAVFDKRTVSVAPYRYLEDLTSNKATESASSQSTIDNETQSYPIPNEFRERYDHIKRDYEVNLLPVYSRKRFVPLEETSDLLNGALAELHLSVTHNYIKKGEERFDSFNGNIRQIVVHAPGSGRPISPYKRKNLHEGPLRPPAGSPYRPPATSSSRAPVESPSRPPAASTSKPSLESPSIKVKGKRIVTSSDDE
ncbi:hypothetical protein JB92DRAFT_2826241 [Gautieria morchelliformis]|nr:hypothetical protein JB92DRAFT_2826241 [Gautieria morchelliformis]